MTDAGHRERALRHPEPDPDPEPVPLTDRRRRGRPALRTDGGAPGDAHADGTAPTDHTRPGSTTHADAPDQRADRLHERVDHAVVVALVVPSAPQVRLLRSVICIPFHGPDLRQHAAAF